MLNKEYLEKRMSELKTIRDQQAANLNVISGQIGEIEYQLQQLQNPPVQIKPADIEQVAEAQAAE
jgi:prefoldin subunit 5